MNTRYDRTMYSRIPANPTKKRSKPPYIPSILISLIFVYVVTIAVWPLQAIEAAIIEQPSTTALTPPTSWPTYGQSALSAKGYGSLGDSGTVEKKPIASITKIITALTVLSAKPITDIENSPQIEFTQKDVDIYNYYYSIDGVVAPVTPGTSISQYDMMQIMLVASANNYAESLAVWAFGSNEAFLAAATKYLQSHNLSATTISDPAGFSDASASTATDLVRIGELALDDATISGIVAKPSVTVADIGTFYTTNLLVTQGEAIGIKTGNTDNAGQCLLFAQKYPLSDETVTIYGAITGGSARSQVANNANTLLDEAAGQFKPVTFAKTNQVFARYEAPWGATTDLISASDASSLVWVGDATKTTVGAPPIKPGDTSAPNAKATFSAGENTTDQSLALTEELAEPSLLWRLTHPMAVLGF